MRMHPTLDSGSWILQKQLAKSRVAMQGESPEVWEERRKAPTSRRVGRRNFGGGVGQFVLRARILMIKAALERLLRFTNTSALGSPGCKATRPAERSASNMAWTRGQLDAFWGGVRASARRRPPGAADNQMSGGMGTHPAAPTP